MSLSEVDFCRIAEDLNAQSGVIRSPPDPSALQSWIAAANGAFALATESRSPFEHRGLATE
jgi:hypothetical protein